MTIASLQYLPALRIKRVCTSGIAFLAQKPAAMSGIYVTRESQTNTGAGGL
jgi:hypothetical protein